MRTVWKYEIPMWEEFTLRYSEYGKILHVAVQDGTPHMWVELEPSEPAVSHYFGIRGTGDKFKGNERDHIATFLTDSFVWHLYWVGRPRIMTTLEKAERIPVDAGL